MGGAVWGRCVGRGRNRRRVDRAEQQARAGQSARSAGRAIAVLLAVAAAALAARQGWRALTGGEALRIAELRVEGNEKVGADELRELSPVKAGDNLLLADVDSVARAVERHPWVARAEVRRRYPPALEIAVEERSAAALVDLGGLYLVDRSGQVFKRAAPGDGLDLPLVTGFTRDDYVQRRSDVEPLLQSALDLAARWSAAGLDGALPLAEVHLDGAEGVTVYAGEQGIQIRLGGGDLAPKLQRLQTVLAALRAEGKAAEVIHLDNRAHPSWVTVRPRVVAGR